MTTIWHEPCPACHQGIVHPVALPALSLEVWLCDECDAIWPLEGSVDQSAPRVRGAGALYVLTEAAHIKDYQTPIRCLLTGFDLKDPRWEDAFRGTISDAANEEKTVGSRPK